MRKVNLMILCWVIASAVSAQAEFIWQLEPGKTVSHGYYQLEEMQELYPNLEEYKKAWIDFHGITENPKRYFQNMPPGWYALPVPAHSNIVVVKQAVELPKGGPEADAEVLVAEDDLAVVAVADSVDFGEFRRELASLETAVQAVVHKVDSNLEQIISEFAPVQHSFEDLSGDIESAKRAFEAQAQSFEELKAAVKEMRAVSAGKAQTYPGYLIWFAVTAAVAACLLIALLIAGYNLQRKTAELQESWRIIDDNLWLDPLSKTYEPRLPDGTAVRFKEDSLNSNQPLADRISIEKRRRRAESVLPINNSYAPTKRPGRARS